VEISAYTLLVFFWINFRATVLGAV